MPRKKWQRVANARLHKHVPVWYACTAELLKDQTGSQYGSKQFI